MKGILNNIKEWWLTLFLTWKNEYKLVFKDAGVLLYFFALPLLYPIAYTLIYNPELVTQVPVAIVDNSRTADSREFSRMLDATQNVEVKGYAANMEEAKRWMKERKVYGILEIPEDYARRIGRNEQAVMQIYCDVSLLLRYREILFAITDLSLQLGSDIRAELLDPTPATAVLSSAGENATIGTQSFFLGDVSQGFASFIMMGIVVFILQQSMVLGVMMLGGGSYERRQRNHGIDPLEVPGPMSASILGRAFCYLTLYAPLVIYILHYVPLMFKLPHVGDPLDFLALMLPMMLAATFMGQMLRPIVTERETSFLVFVFTSVIFLFASGITWPRSDMSGVWLMFSSLIPCTWGSEGFVAISSNGASLSDVKTAYYMLWILAVAFYFIALNVEKLCQRRDLRRYKVPSMR